MSEPDFKSLAASAYEKLKANIVEGVGDGDDELPEGTVDVCNTAMIEGLLIRAYDMGRKDK